MYQNLRFYDSTGYVIDTVYDSESQLHTANIYADTTAVGLWETLAVRLAEVVSYNGVDAISGLCGYRSVRAYYSNNNFKLYDLDGSNIIIKDSIEISVNHNHQKSADGKTVVDKINEYAPVIDLIVCSDDHGYKNDMLIIELDGVIVAEFIIHGEFIGEDERLVNLLANVGESINIDDYRIFRNTTNNVDYRILNNKRKELLLELHNIKPYLSSYKGILNLLEFFDYGDLELREYYSNITTNKIIAVPIGSSVDKNYTKTTKLGLFYRHNIESGDYDNGTPIMKDNFLYDNDTIVVKLFKLREWLQDHEVGGITDIVDIIGEWTYYNSYNISYYNEHYYYRSLPLLDVADITVQDSRITLMDVTNRKYDNLPKISADSRLDQYHSHHIGQYHSGDYYYNHMDGINNSYLDIQAETIVKRSNQFHYDEIFSGYDSVSDTYDNIDGHHHISSIINVIGDDATITDNVIATKKVGVVTVNMTDINYNNNIVTSDPITVTTTMMTPIITAIATIGSLSQSNKAHHKHINTFLQEYNVSNISYKNCKNNWNDYATILWSDVIINPVQLQYWTVSDINNDSWMIVDNQKYSYNSITELLSTNIPGYHICKINDSTVGITGDSYDSIVVESNNTINGLTKNDNDYSIKVVINPTDCHLLKLNTVQSNNIVVGHALLPVYYNVADSDTVGIATAQWYTYSGSMLIDEHKGLHYSMTYAKSGTYTTNCIVTDVNGNVAEVIIPITTIIQ